MPPSQLKRLKASLREQGIVGPQKSKKQKKQNAQNGAKNEKRVRRSIALNGIREQFNPFEYKTSARGPKFDVTTNRTMSGRVSKSVKARPGVTRSDAEKKRRATLLIEMQHKNKTGGIVDRRIGENDPTMAPEEKMMERFIMEKQRRHKHSNPFDLEEEYEPAQLTHMGQSLSFDGPALKDDFEEEGLDEGLDFSDAEDHPSDDERRANKRRRLSGSGDSEGGDAAAQDMPERKKTKQEVMQEVMAKSKFYKYERQKGKEDDDEMREQLDKELPDLRAMLSGIRPGKSAASASDFTNVDPTRLAQMTGDSKEAFDKAYDLRVRQLALDEKAKPTERTKPEEERLAEESRRLQQLEAKRLRRMQGEEEDSDAEDEVDAVDDGSVSNEESDDEFDLGSGIKPRQSLRELGVEDEDDFYIEDDLIASGPEIDEDDFESESENDEADDKADEDNEDDEFTRGLLTAEEATRPEFLTGANGPLPESENPASNGVNGDLAYTFPCPQSHAELLEITSKVVIQDLPLVVQRIRALYHPKLKSENKAQLGKFARSLVDHVSYLACQPDHPPFVVLDTLIRHIHSMSKMFPVEIANCFRKHLESIHRSRALALKSGDLVILTAIGTIFPTSDHFHQVVTPAILTLGRYLGQKIPQTLADFATATYASTLAIQYQRLSKRYVPEVVNSISNTLCALAPSKLSKIPGNFPYHEPKQSLRSKGGVKTSRNLVFFDTTPVPLGEEDEESLKVALIETNIKLLDFAADTWVAKSALTEVFEPSLKILKHLQSKACIHRLPASSKSLLTKVGQKLTILLNQAHLSRRPLELHHHRPLAIKTSIPKFEESYNPDKHYDPNRELAEAKKEKALLKKETKKMMRDIRKDANFVAREQLKEKRIRDEAHDRKQRRLIAEIQGEEGREAKEYERVKAFRKARK